MADTPFVTPLATDGSGAIDVAAFDATLNAALDEIQDVLGAIVTGLTPRGAWAAQGAFPADAARGDFWIVSRAGTVDGQAFAVGDWLVALRSGASPRSYPGHWARADYSRIAKPVHASPVALLASLEPPRGEGALWQTWNGLAWEETAPSATDHVVVTAAGVRLRPLRGHDGSVNAAQFGARGDGVADDRAAIQAAIDFAIFHDAGEARGVVRLDPGRFRVGDTIHLGYGAGLPGGFSSVVLEGAGYRYRGLDTMNGTVLIPTRTDRPCLNIQGARGSVIRGIALHHPVLVDHIDANAMGGSAIPLVDDTAEANWAPPGWHSDADSRYAPFAAISIDAYSGPRPATPYPDVTYPAFLGAVAQYGKAFSSDVLIEDCYVQGFAVGVANQPCDADGNGDFTMLRRCYVEKCKWGVSVGNSQSRNLRIDGMKMSRVYRALTNRTHGRQRGKFGGTVNDLSIFGAIGVLDFGGYYAGPITFTNLYAESLWRIGDIASTSASEPAYLFVGCEFLFGGQRTDGMANPVRGVPATILGGRNQPSLIGFQGCTFHQYLSVALFDQFGVSFEACTFRKDLREKGYERFAHNALCGGLVLPLLGNPVEGDIRHQWFDLDSGEAAGLDRTRLSTRGARRGCLPWYGDAVAAPEEPFDRQENRTLHFRRFAAKASLAACEVSGRTLAIAFAERTEAEFLLWGPLPGDVLMDDRTGTVFFAHWREGATVLAQAQNNHRGDALLEAFSPTEGHIYWRSTRLYTPSAYLRGDTTAGSPVIAQVARDDGAPFAEAEIAPGDAVAVIERQDRWVSPAAARIVARDLGGAGTITLADAAGMRTQERRRLDLFARPGAASQLLP